MIFNIDLSRQTQSSRLQRPRREGKYTRGITSDPIRIPRVRSNVLCCPPDFLPATKGQRKRATIPSPSFPSPFEPDLAKILTVREIFKRVLPRYTEQVRPASRGKATVMSWHGYVKQSLSTSLCAI